MGRSEAMQKYVDTLKQIIETMNFSAEVETFMETLGPFYEVIEDDSKAFSEPSSVPREYSTITSCLDYHKDSTFGIILKMQHDRVFD